MNRFEYPFTRRGLVFVTATILIVVITIALSGSVSIRAQAPGQATKEPPVVVSPVVPPPIQINPPVSTPVPDGQGTSALAAQATQSGLEAIRFRAQERLIKGQPSTLSPNASKSSTNERANATKLPGTQDAGSKEPYLPPDYTSLLGAQDWALSLYEDFEDGLSTAWILEDLSNDGYERYWGINDLYAQIGSQSVWPAAGGADGLDPRRFWYTDNLNSWIEYEFDFSSMSDVFVSFGLWYDTEAEFDWIKFCVSTDFEHYSCDYWSGYSDGWTEQSYWLTSYAGYSQVWLAWVFQSDASVSAGYEGPFVDEIVVFGDDLSATPAPTPTPDPAGQLIQNGSFEEADHLLHWGRNSSPAGLGTVDNTTRPSFSQRPGDVDRPPLALADDEVSVAAIGVVSTTYVDGQWAAFLWQPSGQGQDFLYQAFDVPAGTTDMVINYWFAMTTGETAIDRDSFCASLWSIAPEERVIDLGCMDSINTTGYWRELLYTLTDEELARVEGQEVMLIFEMYNNGTADDYSVGWVDYVRVYATGQGAGAYLDPNEPNDDPDTATTIACGQKISGTIGDIMGGQDIDLFQVTNVPYGQIDVNIDAQVLIPPSALDSVVGLWDNGLTLLTWNDDDGVSYDSYLTYTNQIVGSTLYVSVESYGGAGSHDSFYNLTVECAGEGSGPPPGGTHIPDAAEDTWTVMLYLNAEDAGFESILTQYRKDIEKFIGSKSGFLDVVILYDGSGNGDTVRYEVQPNGNYTTGTNMWNMGELNMGHPDTLANFVIWAMEHYPAENYYLSVDDHGDGVYGISVDGTSNNDMLTPPELYSALKIATANGAKKIDIFDYEACLMGLTENAYDLRQWVDYVVFFEQISWGLDTYPSYFSDLAADDEPLQVGVRIVDRYHQQAMAENNGRGLPHTISFIDTGSLQAVSDAVSALGNALVSTNNKSAVDAARDRSQAFAADSDATNQARAEYIDLWDLADNVSSLARTQATNVKARVDAAVIHEKHASGKVGQYTWDHSGVHGLSIYYPPSKSSSAFENYVAERLYQMSQNGTWDEFLDWALVSGTRRGMNSFRTQDRFISEEDAFAFKDVYVPLILRLK